MGWSVNNRPTTVGGQISTPTGDIDTAHWSNETSTLPLRGAQDWNTDEYDPAVILHEWSHYFSDSFSRSDSPSGNHRLTDLLDLRLAFAEGLATAHGAILKGRSNVIDTAGPNQTGIFVFFRDIERDSAGQGGFFSEASMEELVWDLFDPKSQTPELDWEGPTLPPLPGVDGVELGYKPIYQALRGGYKDTRAFTSIFSFLHHLAAPYLADSALKATIGDQIVTLARGENIDLSTANQYEESPQQLYTVVPTDGTLVTTHGGGPHAGLLLTTRVDHDPLREGNKLDSSVFFRFSVSAAGMYNIEVKPSTEPSSAAGALSVEVNNGGLIAPAHASSGGSPVTIPMVLVPGDYTGSVSARVFSTITGTWVPGAVSFSIRITPK